ncbi:MAG: hypothetical protein H0T51_02840 [Pirellulales bacterium]|nr:hypothetical protein [Pirellulales bacterium]
MWLRFALDLLTSRAPDRQKRRGPARRRPTSRPMRLEALEDRCLLTAFTVTNLLDSGPDSLRAAVEAANANPGADVIDFATTGTIALTSGQLDITDSLTINGPGAGALTVSGNHVSRVFGLAGNPTVSIADLTVANGWSGWRRFSGALDAQKLGGGIYMAGGNLTLARVAVSGNDASGAGGGLYVAGGTLTLDHSSLSGNEAHGADGFTVTGSQAFRAESAEGGGLYVAGGMVYVNQSTFSSNRAVGGAGNEADPCSGISAGDGREGEGGGIYVGGGAVSIDTSTFSGNEALGGNGGAGDYCPDAPSPINSYLPGGSGGPAAGGGIRVAAGTARINQSTVWSNYAVGGLGGDADAGSGVGVGGGLSIAPGVPPLADLDTDTESNTINNFADIDPNISGPYSAAVAGDFDNDGDVDGSDFLSWQRNPGVGNLSDWQANFGQSAGQGPDPAVPVAVTAGDFNDDGWLDIVWRSSTTVSVLLNDQNWSPALPGDNDRDGDVDGNDLLAWQRGGSPNPLSAADLNAWKANFGQTLPPTTSINESAVVTEGNAGITNATITVTLSADYDQLATMSYRTVNYIAMTSDDDYAVQTRALTFAPGETTTSVTIEVKGDNKKESDETCFLDLFNSRSNSLFTKVRGIGTIWNDN